MNEGAPSMPDMPELDAETRQALAERFKEEVQPEMLQEIEALDMSSPAPEAALYQILNQHRLNGMICGVDAMGEFQTAQPDRIKQVFDTILEDGRNPDLYDKRVTLLEEIPGDAARRKLDQIMRMKYRVDVPEEAGGEGENE